MQPKQPSSRYLTEQELEDLKAEMRKSGEYIRECLKAAKASGADQPLSLPIYVTKERWPLEKPSRFD